MKDRLQRAVAQVLELYAYEVSSSPALRELDEALKATGWKPPADEPLRSSAVTEMPWTPCNTCGSVSLRCGCD